MSKVPFYADADSLSRTDSGRREVAVFALYIGLIFLGTIALKIGDKSDVSWVKILMVIWLIGVPLGLMMHIRKNVEAHADELLKTEYYGAAASSCASVIILVLIWVLWGRWFDQIFSDSRNNGIDGVANLAITVAPYLTIWSIYITVRRKMITLSGDVK